MKTRWLNICALVVYGLFLGAPGSFLFEEADQLVSSATRLNQFTLASLRRKQFAGYPLVDPSLGDLQRGDKL